MLLWVEIGQHCVDVKEKKLQTKSQGLTQPESSELSGNTLKGTKQRGRTQPELLAAQMLGRVIVKAGMR